VEALQIARAKSSCESTGIRFLDIAARPPDT